MKTIPAPLAAGDVARLPFSPRCGALCLTAACASLILLSAGSGSAAADFGDAPDGSDSYYPVPAGQTPIPGRFPTLNATTNSRFGAPGVHHTIVGEEWFGPPESPPSAEVDAVDPADPDGRNNLVNNDGFDDGLPPIPFFLVLTSLPPGAAVTFRVTVPAGAPDVYRYVNMLIDWDRSGDWQNLPSPAAPEWVIINRVVDIKPGNSQWITVPITWGLGAQLAPQIFWLRMSLSRTMLDPAVFGPTGWDGSGTFSHGETEDFFFHPSRKHSDPSPFPPPPLPPPPTGGYYSSLPGIVLVPTHQDVAHGTPATVTAQMVDFATGLSITVPPPAYLGWAVDAAFNGPPSIPPAGFQVGGVINWPAGSGSSATWTNGTPPNIATITVNSVIHNFWSPEEWAFRVRAEWPGIHCHTRKAIVHIWHSWPFGCFSLWSHYNFLDFHIESLPLAPADQLILAGHAQDARTAWQQNDLPAMNVALNLLIAKLDQLVAVGQITVADRDQVVATTQEIQAAASLLGTVPVPVCAAPDDGDTVRATVPVTANTLSPNVTRASFSYSGNDGIQHPLGDDTNGVDGWSVPWDTTALADGVYQLHATMENSGGLTGQNQVSVWVDNTVPAPEIVTPLPLAKVIGLTTITVMAPDPNKDVASCTFEISPDSWLWFSLPTDYGGENDDLWQTQIDSGQLSAGMHFLRATVADQAGNTANTVWAVEVMPSYASWKHAYEITDDTADQDGDALHAAMEYYFGTNPTVADPPGSAYGLFQSPLAGWQLWCKRRPLLDGLMVIAEESPDLLNWTELLRDPPDGSGTEMSIEINSELPANFARFHFIETR